MFQLIGSNLKVETALRKLDTTAGRIAAKIHKVLDEKVNPSQSLATHSDGPY